jgi:hypothetical protein
MSNYFSKSTRGFYHSDLHTKIPGDVVELTDEEYKAILAEHYQTGHAIVGGPDGKPTLIHQSKLKPLDEAKKHRALTVTGEAAEEIAEGFPSGVLGEARFYPASDTDQRNLQLAYMIALAPDTPSTWTAKLWSRDMRHNWAYLPHTAQQIRQLGRDAFAARQAAIEKKIDRVERIQNSADHNALLDM